MPETAAAGGGMTSLEKRVTVLLAAVVSARMIGVFMLLPVLAIYAEALAGQRPMLIGLVIGVHGITQAGLQIPLGRLSDRIGRKPVLIGGLLIFAAGSVVAALSDHIAGIIAGRALQGAGAISAALIALLADHTRPVLRTRAMAVVGISVGGSFMLALVLGPALNRLIGVPGLFWAGAGLALAALLIIATGVPESPRREPVAFRLTLENRGTLAGSGLVPAYLGVFVLHVTLTALFIAAPFMLRDQLGILGDDHWRIYLTVLPASLVGTIPLILWSERASRQSVVFMTAMGCLILACVLLGAGIVDRWPVLGALALYFAGFNFLEARLPALVSQKAPEHQRGTALGIYATAQFFGAFVGGVAGGWLLGAYGVPGIFYACALAGLAWLVFSRPRVETPT
ncbi:MAG: MFS transporter [Gammaproteobacteria bacterium]